MQLEHLRNELCNFPLEMLQPFFEDIINQKKKEQQEKEQFENNISKLLKLLKNICFVADHKKRQWMLFDFIGCETEELCLSSVLEQLSIAQLLESINISYALNKKIPIEETREYQIELDTANLRMGAIAYTPENQKILKDRLERYYAELDRYYQKFGRRISEPQFFKIIVNGLKIKDIVPISKNQNDIMNDIIRIVNS